MPNYAYHAAEGEYPVNDQAMPILQNGFTEPLPTNRWRIDESNGGYPYHMLMPDILYVEPDPPPPPEPGPSPVPPPSKRPLRIMIAKIKNADAGNFYK